MVGEAGAMHMAMDKRGRRHARLYGSGCAQCLSIASASSHSFSASAGLCTWRLASNCLRRSFASAMKSSRSTVQLNRVFSDRRYSVHTRSVCVLGAAMPRTSVASSAMAALAESGE